MTTRAIRRIEVVIEGSDEAVQKVERLLCALSLATSWGASRQFALHVDGDGPDQIDVTGVDCATYRAGVDKALGWGLDFQVTSRGFCSGSEGTHRCWTDDGEEA